MPACSTVLDHSKTIFYSMWREECNLTPSQPAPEQTPVYKTYPIRFNTKIMDPLTSKSFYKTHSTPARLLNELLQSCLQLDRAIAGSVNGSGNEIAKANLQDLNPLEYLTSPAFLDMWKTQLAKLFQEYMNGKLTTDEFEERLETVLLGVEKFEEAKGNLESKFEEQLWKAGYGSRISDEFWGGIEKRCKILSEAFSNLDAQLGGMN